MSLSFQGKLLTNFDASRKFQTFKQKLGKTCIYNLSLRALRFSNEAGDDVSKCNFFILHNVIFYFLFWFYVLKNKIYYKIETLIHFILYYILYFK